MIRLGISRESGVTLHFVFEALAYATAAALYLVERKRHGDVVADENRLTLLAAAAVGAAVGSRVLYWLCEPLSTLRRATDVAYLAGGKTIVGALLGGLLAVEVVKRAKGITTPTGDLYVLPLAAGIAVGRIGCFLAGPADQTAGIPSSLPWAVAHWDGVPRHPVALYEIAFIALLLAVLRPWRRSARPPGLSFAIFLASYLAFRLAVDFIKPFPPPVLFGLSAIQLACAAGLVYYAVVIPRRARGELR